MDMSQDSLTDRLRVARHGAPMRISLKRADNLNALDCQPAEALIAALDEVRGDSLA